MPQQRSSKKTVRSAPMPANPPEERITTIERVVEVVKQVQKEVEVEKVVEREVVIEREVYIVVSVCVCVVEENRAGGFHKGIWGRGDERKRNEATIPCSCEL